MGRAQGLTWTPSSDALGTVYEKLTGVDLSQDVLDKERTFPEPQEPQVIYPPSQKTMVVSPWMNATVGPSDLRRP